MSKEFSIGVTIAKQDAARRELHGVAYRAGVLDTAGDYMSVETLRAAAQAALTNGIAVDVEHSLKPLAKSHASIAESYFDEETGSWRIVAKFSPQAWNELVASEKVKGFSIYGTTEGRKSGVAKDESGTEKPGKEILNPKITMVSLVAKPANRTQGPLPVAKSEESETVKLLKALTAKIDAQDARLAQIEKSRGKGGDNVTALRKAQDDADASNAVRVAALERRHAVLSKRLEALWENPSSAEGRSARAAENDLVIEISKTETELEALRGESRYGRSAFGGESKTYDAGQVFVGNDSGLPQPNADLKKAAEDIDLSCLRI